MATQYRRIKALKRRHKLPRTVPGFEYNLMEHLAQRLVNDGDAEFVEVKEVVNDGT